VYPSMENLEDKLLLKELEYRWTNHKIYVKWMSKFFAYLDRTYLRDGPSNSLYALGISIFRTEVFDKVKDATQVAILASIHRDRQGKTINEALLKSIVDMYIELGNDNLELYRSKLHKCIVYETFNYYTQISAEWPSLYTCSEYLKKGEEAIAAERNRCQSYLHNITSAAVQNCVAQALFYARMRELLYKETSLPYMLENDLRE
ncbi:cullin family protein, partial [Cardiosporidium cionae]